MLFSKEKKLISKAWYWRLIAQHVSRTTGRKFRMEYVRDVGNGQRDAPAIKFNMRLAIEDTDRDLEKKGVRVIDFRRKQAKCK